MLPNSSVTHYQESQAIRSSVMREVSSIWGGMSEDFDLSWQTVGPRVNQAITAAQTYSAVSAVEYAVAEGAEVGMSMDIVAPVNVAAFAGYTHDGGLVSDVSRGSVVQAKQAVARGVTVEQALAVGGAWLSRFAVNEVTEASSGALSTAVAASPTTTGFVRMLNPPSCPDCVILAGKWYRWNEGFQRHPGCDCRHVPARESMDELRTNPYDYFNSLSQSEQDKLFGADDAQAIRDGADIYRVRNTRNRGASSGKSWQARRYDSPTVTIDDILRQSRGDRSEAIRLMEKHGFILPDGQVSGGAISGNGWAFSAGAMGRGGTRKGATQAFRDAVQSGNRDPLNPATQTAAERRFHQSYLANEAVKAGRNPFANRPLTDRERQIVEQQWEKQLRLLRSNNSSNMASPQVKSLASLLGVI